MYGGIASVFITEGGAFAERGKLAMVVRSRMAAVAAPECRCTAERAVTALAVSLERPVASASVSS